VEQDGDVLDILVTRHRDWRAAKRFFPKVLKHQGRPPWQQAAMWSIFAPAITPSMVDRPFRRDSAERNAESAVPFPRPSSTRGTIRVHPADGTRQNETK